MTSLSLFGLRTNDRCFTACFAVVLGLGTLQGCGTSAESPELFGRDAAAGAPAGKAGTSTGGAAGTSNGSAGAASGSGGTSSAGAAGASCGDVSSDPNNCGACGHACGSTEQCSGGVCICPPGRSSCTSGCVDLQSDPAHCGTCDRACASTEVCSQGTCQPECSGGTVQCGQSCVDTATSPEHCGGCNTACASGVCENGACTSLATDTLVGWASVAGHGLSTTTGGEGGSVVDVDTASELQSAASSSSKRIIRISGTITVPELVVRSDKTLIGVGTDATLVGGISIVGMSNVIVQNLHVNAKSSAAGGDGIHIQSSHHVWVDHCDIWDAPDGNLDITTQSDLITVSWTRFWYSTSPGDPTHRFCVLIGASDTDPDDGYLNVTFHHNYWAKQIAERMPRVRYGKVHVFNDYFASSGDSYCVRAAYRANVRLENDAFENVQSPHEISLDNGTAIMSASGSSYTGTSGARDTRGTAFTPPYPYQLQAASAVRTAVLAGYGPR